MVSSSLSAPGHIRVQGRYYTKDASLSRHQVLEPISAGDVVEPQFLTCHEQGATQRALCRLPEAAYEDDEYCE